MALESQIPHLLRRAGFGASSSEMVEYEDLGFASVLDGLLNYEQFADDVDAKVGESGYVGVTTRGGPFSPNTLITDARQRWLFRMVHTRRPLQEKMALFWHNHFATGYAKIAGAFGSTVATRMLAAKPSEDPAGAKGQLELFREYALGNFRDLLVKVAQDPAMLVWLDGRTNVRGRPQENFARELMELFTFGVGQYAEQDVYAGARVFTGWNLQRTNAGTDNAYYAFSYNAGQHDTGAKEFSFAIYPDGNRTIPARSASAGMQDGLDFIDAVARHPETGPRLARQLWRFFVSETSDPADRFVSDVAGVYYRTGYNMKAVVLQVLLSPEFLDPANEFARYSWPAEFVVRAMKEIGWIGFSVNSALTPLSNMGQQFFEPPDVAGWELGKGWFTTGAMLARMNFAATLATNQKINLRDAARPYARTPQALLSYLLDRMTPAPLDGPVYGALLDYAQSSAWTGSDTQVATKAAGLAHLIAASGEYQLV